MDPIDPRARRRWTAALAILTPLGLALLVPWRLNYSDTQKNEAFAIPVQFDVANLQPLELQITFPQGAVVDFAPNEIAIEVQGTVEKVKARAIKVSPVPDK